VVAVDLLKPSMLVELMIVLVRRAPGPARKKVWSKESG
jgi:hypothetical protein